ncbi:MAG: hypothetical protein SynsKO_05450 [Synoicihabitans sp.]
MSDQPLTDEEITQTLMTLLGWEREGDELTKTFSFGDFRSAMGFMVRAGFEAEAHDHHPAWTNVYNRVEVRLNTHSAGGKITAKDFALAQAFDQIAPTA